MGPSVWPPCSAAGAAQSAGLKVECQTRSAPCAQPQPGSAAPAQSPPGSGAPAAGARRQTAAAPMPAGLQAGVLARGQAEQARAAAQTPAAAFLPAHPGAGPSRRLAAVVAPLRGADRQLVTELPSTRSSAPVLRRGGVLPWAASQLGKQASPAARHRAGKSEEDTTVPPFAAHRAASQQAAATESARGDRFSDAKQGVTVVTAGSRIGDLRRGAGHSVRRVAGAFDSGQAEQPPAVRKPSLSPSARVEAALAVAAGAQPRPERYRAHAHGRATPLRALGGRHCGEGVRLAVGAQLLAQWTTAARTTSPTCSPPAWAGAKPNVRVRLALVEGPLLLLTARRGLRRGRGTEGPSLPLQRSLWQRLHPCLQCRHLRHRLAVPQHACLTRLSCPTRRRGRGAEARGEQPQDAAPAGAPVLAAP